MSENLTKFFKTILLYQNIADTLNSQTLILKICVV